jgi:DNA polymerase
MPDEVLDVLRETARQLGEQLRFYQQIGITDIGSPARKEAPELTKQINTAEEGDLKTYPEFGQVDLFGEPVVERPPARTVNLGLFPAKVDASLEQIRDDIGDCRRCRLCDHRTNIVFGEGHPKAQLMFIGEGPGADEDTTGRPFVGRAGQLLDKIISAIGFRREDVYIANVVKCRPPGNRAPERDEAATCEPFLFRQIAVIHPKVIVTLGSPALQCILRSRDSITKARGEWRECEGIAVMPTFHPAYLLRSPDRKREVWEDMKKVRHYLETGVK